MILLQPLEPRLLMASSIRSYDGSGNNPLHTDWGTPRSASAASRRSCVRRRHLDARRCEPPVGAREISNYFLQQHLAEDIFNAEGMSAFVYAWGQFIDHDLSLTNTATRPPNRSTFRYPGRPSVRIWISLDSR